VGRREGEKKRERRGREGKRKSNRDI